jgi:hypothetical protein
MLPDFKDSPKTAINVQRQILKNATDEQKKQARM